MQTPYLDELHDFYEDEYNNFILPNILNMQKPRTVVQIAQMLRTSMYMPGANIADAQDFSDKLCFQYRKLSSSKLLIQQLNEQARIVGFLTFYALDNPRFVNEFAR